MTLDDELGCEPYTLEHAIEARVQIAGMLAVAPGRDIQIPVITGGEVAVRGHSAMVRMEDEANDAVYLFGPVPIDCVPGPEALKLHALASVFAPLN